METENMSATEIVEAEILEIIRNKGFSTSSMVLDSLEEKGHEIHRTTVTNQVMHMFKHGKLAREPLPACKRRNNGLRYRYIMPSGTGFTVGDLLKMKWVPA
jgi:predicted transcriptional regulator